MHIILIYNYVLGLVDLLKTYLYILGHFDSMCLYNDKINQTKYPQMHVIVKRYLYSRHISLFTSFLYRKISGKKSKNAHPLKKCNLYPKSLCITTIKNQQKIQRICFKSKSFKKDAISFLNSMTVYNET